jgi:transposase
MLAWMRSLGQLDRVGVEATGTYGAGLLRHLEAAGVEVLEITAPDKTDRRRRGKNDDFDAEAAAHAFFARKRAVTPKRRDGMIEALRVLKTRGKTAVSARRIALQIIHHTIVSAPEELRDTVRRMTRMQLVRTLAAWRPDLTDYRNPVSAYRIALKSLARRYLELHDEIADLDVINAAILEKLRSCGAELDGPRLRRAAAADHRRHSGASEVGGQLRGTVRRLSDQASSGKTIRHRLNRGGDRAANRALHIIAIGRLRSDERTKARSSPSFAIGDARSTRPNSRLDT